MTKSIRALTATDGGKCTLCNVRRPSEEKLNDWGLAAWIRDKIVLLDGEEETLSHYGYRAATGRFDVGEALKFPSSRTEIWPISDKEEAEIRDTNAKLKTAAETRRTEAASRPPVGHLENREDNFVWINPDGTERPV